MTYLIVCAIVLLTSLFIGSRYHQAYQRRTQLERKRKLYGPIRKFGD